MPTQSHLVLDKILFVQQKPDRHFTVILAWNLDEHERWQKSKSPQLRHAALWGH